MSNSKRNQVGDLLKSQAENLLLITCHIDDQVRVETRIPVWIQVRTRVENLVWDMGKLSGEGP